MQLIISLCFFMSMTVMAQSTFTTSIHEIDMGSSPDEQALILMTNGRIARMHLNQIEILDQLVEARQKGTRLELTLNQLTEIISIKELPPLLPIADLSFQAANKSMSAINYTPSVIGSPEAALRIFKEHQYNAKDSQCFNRAHIWSYEWRVKHNLYSSKIWIYFTRKFIRSRPTFEWWFHVAPLVYVNENGAVKERAMDIKYSSRPLPIQKWADTFLKGKGPCLTIQKFSEYANYPYSGDCYFQKSSMYFYQPSDLEFLEKFGTEKNAWVETEVREAYREAFDIY